MSVFLELFFCSFIDATPTPVAADANKKAFRMIKYVPLGHLHISIQIHAYVLNITLLRSGSFILLFRIHFRVFQFHSTRSLAGCGVELLSMKSQARSRPWQLHFDVGLMQYLYCSMNLRVQEVQMAKIIRVPLYGVPPTEIALVARNTNKLSCLKLLSAIIFLPFIVLVNGKPCSYSSYIHALEHFNMDDFKKICTTTVVSF